MESNLRLGPICIDSPMSAIVGRNGHNFCGIKMMFRAKYRINTVGVKRLRTSGGLYLELLLDIVTVMKLSEMMWRELSRGNCYAISDCTCDNCDCGSIISINDRYLKFYCLNWDEASSCSKCQWSANDDNRHSIQFKCAVYNEKVDDLSQVLGVNRWSFSELVSLKDTTFPLAQDCLGVDETSDSKGCLV